MERSRKETAFDFGRDARCTGRIDWSDPAGPVLIWPGSSIAVSFEGSSIAFTMLRAERDDSWIDMFVDGEKTGTVHVGEAGESGTIALQGLGAGPHTVEIVKRTEAMFGTIRCLGFELPEGGTFLPPPARMNRRIELIGDSISAGSGNEGKDGDPNIAAHENHLLSYGSLAAQSVGAELHTIAVSGIGLVANYGDERTGTMPEQYGRLNPLQPDSRWDFETWIPDVAVINLGTNDNNYAIEEREFIEAYKSFVARIRGFYPDARIMMALGPFMLSPVKAYIEQAFAEIRGAGDSRVDCFFFDPIDTERDGLGETGHPTVRTHARMAERLIQALKDTMGW